MKKGEAARPPGDGIDAYVEALKATQLFVGLSNRQITAAAASAEAFAERYDKGDVLWRQGQAIQAIAVLTQGDLLSQIEQLDGNIQLIRSFTAPALIGLDAAVSRKSTSFTNLVMRTAGTILWIPYPRLVKDPDIPEAVRWLILENAAIALADESIRGLKKSGVLARFSAKERAIAFLSILRDKYRKDTFDIGMNQSEFASYLCVSRTTLSEALSKMREEGVIDYAGTVYTLKTPVRRWRGRRR
jgi:CRP-like cAMP-binding protein